MSFSCDEETDPGESQARLEPTFPVAGHVTNQRELIHLMVYLLDTQTCSWNPLLIEESGLQDFGGALLRYDAARRVSHNVHVWLTEHLGTRLPGFSSGDGSSKVQRNERVLRIDEMRGDMRGGVVWSWCKRWHLSLLC